MNTEDATALIAILSQSTDKHRIHRSLLKLRSQLLGRNSAAGIDLFYRLNGIPPLVRLISKPYEKIIDVGLSILANCCVNKHCCRQAIALGIVPLLLSIIKSIPNAAVQCRACRLLGNLARESNEKLCGLAKGLGVAIAAVLDYSTDVNTLNMSVRAARLLWTEMPFYDEFVRHDGVQRIVRHLIAQTKTVAAVAVPRCEAGAQSQPMNQMEIHVRNIQFMEAVNSKVFDREILKKEPARTDAELFGYPAEEEKGGKERRELIAELMRSLQALTSRLSHRIVRDVFAVELSCNCIVYFARRESPLRAPALRILSNLAKSVPASAEHLSRADAVTAACRLITQADTEPRLTEVEERHCVAIICVLAGDACNRAKIRRSGAFARIMEVAKSTGCNQVLTSILMGLQNFRFDNNSLDQMIRVGLVAVLVERLDRLTVDMSAEHPVRPIKRPPAPAEQLKSVTAALERSAQVAAEDAAAAAVEEAENYQGMRSFREAIAHSRRRDRLPYAVVRQYTFPSSPVSADGSPSRSPLCGSPSRSPAGGDDDEDMVSEYSPVCSDIEDGDVAGLVMAIEDTDTEDEEEEEEAAAEAEAADEDGDGQSDRAAALGQSAEVMRLLEECSVAVEGGGGGGSGSGKATKRGKGRGKRGGAPRKADPIDSDGAESDSTKADTTPPMYSPDAEAKLKTAHLIIDTLCIVSFRIKYATKLCTTTLLRTLVRACRVAYRQRDSNAMRWDSQGAAQVLSHIVEETRNFVVIVQQQDIVFKVWQMTQVTAEHAKCGQCNELQLIGEGLLAHLTTVGETGYGRGELARLLAHGTADTRTQIAIVTLYIIRQPKYLHQLCIEHRGLRTVLELILQRPPAAPPAATVAANELALYAATGLTVLARVLGIRVPDCNAALIDRLDRFRLDTRYVAVAETEVEADDASVIWFVAGGDGGGSGEPEQRVAFDRGTLIAASDVFASMLLNDFRESHERQIRLPRQTIAGIRYFLDAMQQLRGGRRLRQPAGRLIGAVLEAYDMAQMYMLAELETAAYNMVLALLAPDTVLAVFEFAMRQHKQELATLAVAYYVCCAVEGGRKVRMFREANGSEFRRDWADMVREHIVYGLGGAGAERY